MAARSRQCGRPRSNRPEQAGPAGRFETERGRFMTGHGGPCPLKRSITASRCAATATLGSRHRDHDGCGAARDAVPPLLQTQRSVQRSAVSLAAETSTHERRSSAPLNDASGPPLTSNCTRPAGASSATAPDRPGLIVPENPLSLCQVTNLGAGTYNFETKDSRWS